MNVIETERLQIRNFTTDDWQALQDVIIHYQASDSAKYEPPWPTSDKEVQDIAKWFAAGDDYLCVCLKATATIIGLLAIERRNDHEEPVRNLGYVFDPAYRGHGYALEGCRAIMSYVFEKLGAVAIHTGTHPVNEASVRLLTKLGLKRINQGEFVLSREEWQALDLAVQYAVDSSGMTEPRKVSEPSLPAGRRSSFLEVGPINSNRHV
jgi:RimJ/RimL family protein N-acetyltransferase